MREDEILNLECGKCGKCGKKIDILSEGAYCITLEREHPEADKLHKGEGILWSSSPYCSKKCLEESTEKISYDFISWLQEENLARQILRGMGFKP